MTLDKTTNVCLTCRYFDDHESTCQRFPPNIRVTTADELGQEDVWYVQPVIDLEWSTTCGEWQPDKPDETWLDRVTRVGARINEWKASQNDQSEGNQ